MEDCKFESTKLKYKQEELNLVLDSIKKLEKQFGQKVPIKELNDFLKNKFTYQKVSRIIWILMIKAEVFKPTGKTVKRI